MTTTPDYAALAKAAGAVQSDAAATPSASVTPDAPASASPVVTQAAAPALAPGGVDYAVLAKQAGAINTAQQAPPGTAPTAPIAPAANSADVHQGSTAWQKVKQRLFEPVSEDEIERIPGLEPNRVQMLEDQGQAVGQQTLESVFGKQKGDMIREHIALGFPPEVAARAAAKTLTDWYSPAMLAASVPGRIAHGYAAGAEAAEKLGDAAKAAEYAGKARLAGIIGTVSGIPFNAGQITSLVENWKNMSPAERGASVAGVLGGTALSGVAVHEAVAPGTTNQKAAAVQQKATEQAQQGHELSYQDIKTAIPPSKTANWTRGDFDQAKPILDVLHQTNPANTVEGLRDAATNGVHKIEDQISQTIAAHPEVGKNSSDFNPLENVRQELAKHPRGEEFVNSGLKKLEGFKLDEPKTLEQWDNVRRTLNAESSGIMKKNSWDRYTAEASDPKVKAANVAADAIREHIADTLEDAGEPGIRQLRQIEGSLIKIRNAAERQALSGEKEVPNTGKGGALRKIATGTAGRVVAGAAGGALGATLGGPAGAVGGTVAGEEAARLLGQKLGTENLTRDQLVERAMNRKGLPLPELWAGPTPAKQPAGLLGSGPLVTPLPDTSSVTGTPAEPVQGTRAIRRGLLLPERTGPGGLDATERGPNGGPGPNQVPPPIELRPSSITLKDLQSVDLRGFDPAKDSLLDFLHRTNQLPKANPNEAGAASAAVSVPAEKAPKPETGKQGILDRVRAALMQPPAWYREGADVADRYKTWINSPIGEQPDVNQPPINEKFPWESVEPEPKQMDVARLPFQKPSQISGLVLPEGYDTTAVHHHELAHTYVGAEEGLHPIDIVSNTHKDVSPLTAAAARFAKSDFQLDPNMSAGEANDRVDKILSTLFAGAAANELYDGIPHMENKGVSGDFEIAKRVLKQANVPLKNYESFITGAVNRAKEHLTKPGVSDIIKGAAQTREGGLSETHLYSGQRMQEIINNAREARDAIIGKPTDESGERDTAGRSARTGKATGSAAAGNESENAPATAKTAGLKESSTGDTKVDDVIKAAGGIPAGSMLGLAMFHDPKTGSTLALDKGDVTPEAVQKHLEASRAKFGVSAK